MNRKKGQTALHGTEARARRHQRAGQIPVRRYCPACANAQTRARALRKNVTGTLPECPDVGSARSTGRKKTETLPRNCFTSRQFRGRL